MRYLHGEADGSKGERERERERQRERELRLAEQIYVHAVNIQIHVCDIYVVLENLHSKNLCFLYVLFALNFIAAELLYSESCFPIVALCSAVEAV